MAKQEGWQRGSRHDDIPLKPFRDPISGKVVPQNPQGAPRSLADDLGSVPKADRNGLDT